MEYRIIIAIGHRRAVENIQEDHYCGGYAGQRVVAGVAVSGVAHPGSYILIDVERAWVGPEEAKLQSQGLLYSCNRQIVEET